MHGYVRDRPCKPNIYLSCSTSEIRVTLVPPNMFKPSSNFLTDSSKAVLLLWNFFLFVFRLCRLFLASLWSPDRKGLIFFFTFL